MRYFEYGALAVLVIGVFLVLAFGFNTSTLTDASGTVIATPASSTTGSDVMLGSGCGIHEDPVLTASLDFSGNNEYALDTGKLVVNGKSINVYSGDNLVGRFNMNGSGMVVPAGSQPDGNIVKSAYSGPPGDTRSTYRIYPSSFASDKSVHAYLAIDFAGGNATVTPGSDVGRTHAKSFREGLGVGDGSVSDAAGCASSGGG